MRSLIVCAVGGLIGGAVLAAFGVELFSHTYWAATSLGVVGYCTGAVAERVDGG